MNEETLKIFVAKLTKRLYDLCKERATGSIKIEANLSQGGIGEADIELSWKERLK